MQIDYEFLLKVQSLTDNTGMRVYIEYMSLMNKLNRKPTYDELMKQSGMEERTLKMYVGALKENDLIVEKTESQIIEEETYRMDIMDALDRIMSTYCVNGVFVSDSAKQQAIDINTQWIDNRINSNPSRENLLKDCLNRWIDKVNKM